MEVENEEGNSVSITPCSVRKNLFSKCENSEDSGFYSVTPGSREQSYQAKYDCSFNKSNGDHFMTPNSDNLTGIQVTPFIRNTRSFGKIAQSSCIREVDHEKMIDICCSPIMNVDASSQNEKMEVGCHDKTIYMECEDSFYDDPVARNLLHASTVLEKDNNKEASYTRAKQEPTSSIVENKTASHNVNKLKTPVMAPKTNSPSRFKNQRKCSLWRKTLYGFEFVDFLYFLGQKHSYPHIITKILSYLSLDDLLNVTAVSKTWQQVCNNDLLARKKLYQHKRSCAAAKENVKTLDSEGRKFGPRPLFSQIQNFQNYKSPVPGQSPTQVSPRTQRFKLFCKEGEKLDQKSKLMACPRCSLPARCSSPATNNLGQCLCKNCQYRFCTVCLKAFHYPSPCYRISSCPVRRSSNSRQSMIIGSKASKRRLSRT